MSESTPSSTQATQSNDDTYESIVILIGVVMTGTVVVAFITTIVYVFILRRNERKARKHRQLTKLKTQQRPRPKPVPHPRPLPISTTASTDINDAKVSPEVGKEEQLSSVRVTATPLVPLSLKSQRPITQSPHVVKTPVIEPPIRQPESSVPMQKTQSSSERGYVEEFIANQSVISTLRRPAESDGPVDDSRLLDAFQI
uniref:DAG1 domain-containing protein n=1 Tax=Panagrellus redivivus TaxID=6233 RepID=A0A7E4VM02_PANRE